jgi:hypothetical protein
VSDATPAVETLVPDFAKPGAITVAVIPKQDRERYSGVKVFRADSEGKIVKSDYLCGYTFTFRTMEVTDVRSYGEFISKTMMGAPHAFVLRGCPKTGVRLDEGCRRLNAIFKDVPRAWLDVDFDAVDIPRGPAGAEAARNLLPEAFRNATCWWQRTGSYGVGYEGREGDPWKGRIRLGFWLDAPLTGAQIRHWFRELPEGVVDLSIYAQVQPHYTGAPVFQGCEDPLIAAGEDRFGFFGGAVDAVQVPQAMATWAETIDVSRIAERLVMTPQFRIYLMRAKDLIENVEGTRHRSLHRWACDAYALGMEESEIIQHGSVILSSFRRLSEEPTNAEKNEVKRMIQYAESAHKHGGLWVSRGLCPNLDFLPELEKAATLPTVDGKPPQLPPEPALTPQEAVDQEGNTVHWSESLTRTPTGKVEPSERNGAIVFASHSAMAGSLMWSLFSNAPVLIRQPPWWDMRAPEMNGPIPVFGQPLADADYEDSMIWLQNLRPESHGDEGTPVRLGKDTLCIAIKNAARRRASNPVKDWLVACRKAWDGKPRLESVLTRVCKADMPQRLAAIYFKKWMVQAVRRICEPGAKADGVLVLQGGQGAKKSTFFASLLPDKQFFKEGLSRIDNKDAPIELHGKIIVELAEGFVLKKSDAEGLKAFLTTNDDVFRAPFGITAERHPRTCVFAASVNDSQFLPEIGGRRWWVVPVASRSDVLQGNRIDLEAVIAERDQWWGEAMHLYEKGYECWLDNHDEAAAEKHTADFSEDAETMYAVERWLKLSPAEGGPPHPDWFEPKDLWVRCLSRDACDFRAMGRRVSSIMQAFHEWGRKQYYVNDVDRKFSGYGKLSSRFMTDMRYRNSVLKTLYTGGVPEVAIDSVAQPAKT